MLESLDLPLGVVLGTFGVERHRITWRGQAAHAGSTPMDRRRDALAGAAKLALEIRDIARADGRRSRLHVRRRRLQAGDRDVGRGDGRAAPRPAPSRRADARGDAGRGEGAPASASPPRSRSTSSGSRIWSIEPILFDETLHRLLRGGDPRGRWHGAPAPLRPAPRRSRGVARRRADGDAVRPEPPRPLAHEARGHEGGAPRARRRRARPARVEDDRLGRERRRALTVLTARRSPAAVVAGLAVGGCLTWNVSNVGAGRRPARRALRRLARGGRPADDRALRDAPRRPAPRGPRSRSLRVAARRAARDRGRRRRERRPPRSTQASSWRSSAGRSSASARARRSSPGSTSCAPEAAARRSRASTAARRWPAAGSRSWSCRR